jgi:hypothetical protein
LDSRIGGSFHHDTAAERVPLPIGCTVNPGPFERDYAVDLAAAPLLDEWWVYEDGCGGIALGGRVDGHLILTGALDTIAKDRLWAMAGGLYALGKPE